MYIVHACSSISYEAPGKYPKLKVVSPNEYYAEVLNEDYAGKVSELTAVNQYEYHYIANRRDDEAAAKHLGRIEEVERRHLEIVGELIRLLGKNPVFRSSFYEERSYWNGKNVAYGNDLKEQLKADLNTEYCTIRNYNTHIKLISDPYIKTVLHRIIDDEYVHVHILEALIRGDR